MEGVALTVEPLAPREDFPLLARTIEGKRIVYLDSAATTLKPRPVIDAVVEFYRNFCANVHRGDHTLSREASERLEQVRYQVARFINATSREIVFTANTTDGINLVAESLGLAPTDNVVVTILDHHSNILPWMGRCETRFLPEGPDGAVDLNKLPDLIDARTRLVAMGHVSNVTGAIQPVAEAIAIAHDRGVPVVIDAAQSAPHLPLDVLALGCDFLAFSSHKMLGPSGVGVLYVSEDAEERLSPRRLGGGTPDHVRTDGFSLRDVPYRLEPGTPNIEGILGFGAAIEYLKRIGTERIAAHDAALCRAMTRHLVDLPGVRAIGSGAGDKIATVSLLPTDATLTATTLGHLLSDSYKIMARSGTHCAHPYFAAHGAGKALRLSTYVYTGEDDIELAASALAEIFFHRKST